MKKLVLFLGVITFIFAIDNKAYAGELNEHEQAIIEAASETYEYMGESYKVDQIYLDQLTEYLKRDNIDISSEDKDLIIHWALDNIELGVNDGYLLPVDKQENQSNQVNPINISNSIEGSNAYGILKDTLESTGKDIADINDPLPSTILEDDITENTAENITINNTENTAENITKSNTENIAENTKKNITDNYENTAESKNNNTENMTESITNTNTDEKSTEDEIIKQSGFNLNISLCIIIGIGILMLVGIIVAIKNNYFSDNAYE